MSHIENHAGALALKLTQEAARKQAEADRTVAVIHAMGDAALALPAWTISGEYAAHKGIALTLHGNGQIDRAEFETLIKAFPPVDTVLYTTGQWAPVAIPASFVATKAERDRCESPKVTPIDGVTFQVDRYGHTCNIKVEWFSRLGNGQIVELNYQIKPRARAVMFTASKIGTKYIYDPSIQWQPGELKAAMLDCRGSSRRVDNTSWPTYEYHAAQHGKAIKAVRCMFDPE